MNIQKVRLDAYFDKLKRENKRVPSYAEKAKPHLFKISIGSGVGHRYLTTPESCRRINLAVEELGLDVKRGASQVRRKNHVEQTLEQVSEYLLWLEERGLTLPENPKRRGEVFFKQLKVELGLAPNALSERDGKLGKEVSDAFAKMIESAVPRLGLEVRVLTYSVGSNAPPFTYALLYEKGTEEREQELAGSSNARQQLYNTRSALKRFCKVSGLNLAETIGSELLVNFEKRVSEVLATIKNVRTQRKFNTEIRRWFDYYQSFVREDCLPEDFQQCFAKLVDMSGLPMTVFARLIDAPAATLWGWYKGQVTPRSESFETISRMEALCKLPSGSLVSKIPGHKQRQRITFSRLPEFLRGKRTLTSRICRQLPDDFLQRPPEQQKSIFESIRNNILRSNNPYNLRQSELQKLPYRLKVWPTLLEQEFEELAFFKTEERPPLGMQRNKQWRLSTRDMVKRELDSFFGALRLPADATDKRVRGLGVPESNLTLALVTCPLVLDWYIRFRCGARTQYSAFATNLLGRVIGLLRAETGWLRQNPYLASRLSTITCEKTVLISPDLIARAESDWDGFCQDAIAFYENLQRELEPLINISRDPFLPIDGIIKLENPMSAFNVLLRGMRSELPNRHTQSFLYHTAIRDCALVALIAATGLRRNTIVQLDYTGDETGHILLRDGFVDLNIPRIFFKEPDSPFFGSGDTQVDYSNRLSNVYGLVEFFTEYLNVSRPFLLSKCHPKCKEQPLFVLSGRGKTARMIPNVITAIYYKYAERHLVENIWRGTGISRVRPHGPHSARHIRGTTVAKKTGSFELAADANHHSVEMARRFYAKFLPEDRNRLVNSVLFGDE